MVYAMLSIGVLGFIVWSDVYSKNIMALLLHNEIICVIINIFTICWYIFKLYNTFYSENLYNYVKSAGNNSLIVRKNIKSNQKIETSETLRENNFSFCTFRKVYSLFF